MEFSEHMLVLQVGKFREADLWIRLLSPTRGVISAFAFGGSRSRRRFVGCLDILNEISVRVSSSGRGAYLALQESVLIRGLSRLRGDWPRFGLAVNCVRFLQSMDIGPDGAEQAHCLMLQTLRLLEEQTAVPRLLPLFFRARLAFDQGYALHAGHCGMCKREILEEGGVFLLREGFLLCRQCASSRRDQRQILGAETLRCIESIRERQPEQWCDMALSPQAMREFSSLMDGFIQYHVGIVWDRGRFIKQ